VFEHCFLFFDLCGERSELFPRLDFLCLSLGERGFGRLKFGVELSPLLFNDGDAFLEA
jgi:hypothetical protein